MMTTLEEAYLDYMAGMKYKDIAKKHNVSVNTVRSWKTRNGWIRATSNKSKPKKKECAPQINVRRKCAVPAKDKKLRKEIEEDLIEQLNEKGAAYAHYIDMVRDYMSLWDIKNLLNADIKERGAVVKWNGNLKKNDSIQEFNKTNAQMLKILSELGLKAERPKGKEKVGGDDSAFVEV